MIGSAAAVAIPAGPRSGCYRRQRCQRHVEGVHEAAGLIGQMHLTLELPAEGLDQARAEAALLWSPHHGAVLLGPSQMQTLRLRLERPGDLDAAVGNRQCAEL